MSTTDSPRNDLWEVALSGEALPDTPADTIELARAVRLAMEKTAQDLMPSDASCDAAWRKISAATATSKNKREHHADWWATLLRPVALAPALSVLLMMTVCVVLWREQTPPIDTVAFRSGIQIVTAPDATAPTPRIVAELHDLGLTPHLQKNKKGLIVEVEWPVKPTQEMEDWLALQQLTLMPDRKLHILIVQQKK